MVCTGVIKGSDNLKSFSSREAASLSCSQLQLCRCHSQALVKGHEWAPARLFPTGRTCGSWSVCHRRPRPLSCCASRDRTSCLVTMKWFSLVTAALRENFSHLKLSHTLRLSLDSDFGPQTRPLNFPPASLWFYLLPRCVCVCVPVYIVCMFCSLASAPFALPCRCLFVDFLWNSSFLPFCCSPCGPLLCAPSLFFNPTLPESVRMSSGLLCKRHGRGMDLVLECHTPDQPP